jgi:hypothetical protein
VGKYSGFARSFISAANSGLRLEPSIGFSIADAGSARISAMVGKMSTVPAG